MLRIQQKQLNLYSDIYSRIPENHVLKQIDKVVCFSFVNELLADSYCTNFGRPAKEPEMMVKLLLLQKLYNLSDEDVIEESGLNLAYMYFLGINPDDDLPHPSLLSKFRNLRLKDTDLDDMLCEIARQCVEKGIIEAKNGITTDTTHILANTTKKVPERIMKHLARRIFKAMKQTDYDIPDYTQIENHKEAKQVMKDFLEETIEKAMTTADESVRESVQKETELAKEILSSPLFIEQKGIRSLVDTDARVGYKSKTESFFGYKAEISQTTKEGIITAVGVHNGAYVDGTDFGKFYKLSKVIGIDIKAFYGDKAYFKQHILGPLKTDNVKAYIPVSASSYRIDEELYSYNKDSDRWICVQGNMTMSKKHKVSKRKDIGEYKFYEYTFAKEGCIDCPRREECIKKAKTKSKKLQVSLNTAEYYEHSQWANTEEFKEEYKKRSASEWKNAELKRFHGLDRACGYGLKSVNCQAKLTAISVNLKRIAKLTALKVIHFPMNMQAVRQREGNVLFFDLAAA